MGTKNREYLKRKMRKKFRTISPLTFCGLEKCRRRGKCLLKYNGAATWTLTNLDIRRLLTDKEAWLLDNPHTSANKRI